jgi:hypothetical protein
MDCLIPCNHDLTGQQQDPGCSANQIYPTLALFGTAYTALIIEDHGKLVAIDTESSESSMQVAPIQHEVFEARVNGEWYIS